MPPKGLPGQIIKKTRYASTKFTAEFPTDAEMEHRNVLSLRSSFKTWQTRGDKVWVCGISNAGVQLQTLSRHHLRTCQAWAHIPI